MKPLRTLLSRTRIGRLSTYTGVAITVVWALVAAGPALALVMVCAVAVAVAAARLRRNRQLLISVGAAVLTTALTVTATLWMMQHADSDHQVVAGALTGFVLVSPVPAALAWLWPPNLGHRHVLAAGGSLVLLAGAAIPVITGRPTGSAAILLGSLGVIIFGYATYHRRQHLRCSRDSIQTPFGWTDFGIRSLADGSTAQLLYHRGALMVCQHTASITPGRAVTRRAVRAASAAAADLRVKPRHTQPVLLCPDQDPTAVGMIRGGADEQEATVLLVHPDALELATAGAPARRIVRRQLTAFALLSGPRR